MKKICKICKEFKECPVKGMCRECYNKKWNLENKEKINTYNKKYRLENSEKLKAAIRKWQKENSEKVNAKNRKWRKENSERAKAIRRKYYAENKEKENARTREYYLKHQEELSKYGRKYSKKWQAEHKEEKAKYRKEYRQTPNGKLTTKRGNMNRRAYGTIKIGTLERLVNTNILKYGVVTCEKCKRDCEDNFHVDHIIPISKGGSNEYNNLQILCAKHNMKKHVNIVDYRQDVENNQIFLKG